MREFELIETLRQRLQARREDTRTGIGDDAAVLAPPSGHELVVTSDTLVAGRHFPADTTAFAIGFKALAVNLSDVAAMGAEPAWATLALTAPELAAPWCEAFIDGALAAIGAADVDIVGGDTTSGSLSITVTAFGLVPTGTAILRSGAQVGDLVCVTGTLGDAALGLRLWQADTLDGADAQWLYQRLCQPQWRNGAAMRGLAHAALDVSDGLTADLGHVLTASGCGARIDVDALPTSKAFVALCPAGQRRALQLAGGDDYELCITVPATAFAALASALGCQLTAIGRIEAEPGLRLADGSGEPVTIDSRGWDHFR